MKAINFTCEQCGKDCRKPRRTTTARYFCSTTCSTAWRRENPAMPYICDRCKQPFGYASTNGRAHARRKNTRTFCSRACWKLTKAEEKMAYAKKADQVKKQYMQQYHRTYYKANKVKILEKNKRWANDPRTRPNRAAYSRRHRAMYPERFAVRRKRTFSSIDWIELKAQYGNMCLCCHMKEPTIRLEADHVIPIAHGGSHSIENIQPLCVSCNRKKHVRRTDFRI